MFEPTRDEVAHAEDMLMSLLTQGREILHSPKGHAERIKEQQEEAALRSAQASAAVLARLQWRPRASIALINLCSCQTCKSSRSLFAGFGILMYRNADDSSRIVMTPQLDPAYPRQTHYTQTITAACADCLSQFGFTLGDPHG